MSSLEETLQRVERLAASGATADARSLVSLLGEDDWQTRRAAAEAIAATVCASAHETDHEPLFEELIAAVCDKTRAGKRAAAIAALEGIGKRALPYLATELQNGNASERIALTGIIGHAGGVEAVRLLAPLLHDVDTNVAAATIAALGRTRSQEAAPHLLEQLNTGDDWLRFAAVGALGELGDTRAIEKLEQLLEENLTQEAAAAALVEIGTVEAATALAGHLRAPDGALRPAVLAALVSLGRDENAAPLVFAQRVSASARKAFRASSDATTYSDLMRLMQRGEHGQADTCLTALGWLGDAQAVSIIARALDDSSLLKTARKALSDLAHEPQALQAMLGSNYLPAAELAAALGNAKSLLAIEAAARLSVETDEAETIEASLAALAQGREWLYQQKHLASIRSEESERLAERLRQTLRAAQGRAQREIALTLGALAPFLHPLTIGAIAEQLSRSEAEDAVLARLSMIQRADPALLLEEATWAEHHPNAIVRMAAIELLSRRVGTTQPLSLLQHLTDEAAGVRRATTRALRYGAATDEAQRALLACLADEDIWVRAEALTTLGALFGREPAAHAALHEALTAAHPLCRVAACDALAEQASARDWQALSRMARRDPQTEARRAAVQAFAHCKQPRTAFSVARVALADSEWSVRRAGVEALAAATEPTSLKLLLEVAGNQSEKATVRGAAMRALARRDAKQTIPLLCLALSDADATLIEDAYAALLILLPTRRAEIQQVRQSCAPRAANIINFLLSDEKKTVFSF